jgi:hypothetical protein
MEKGISRGAGVMRSNGDGDGNLGEGMVMGTTGTAVKGASSPQWVWQMKIPYLDTIGKNFTITVYYSFQFNWYFPLLGIHPAACGISLVLKEILRYSPVVLFLP